MNTMKHIVFGLAAFSFALASCGEDSTVESCQNYSQAFECSIAKNGIQISDAQHTRLVDGCVESMNSDACSTEDQTRINNASQCFFDATGTCSTDDAATDTCWDAIPEASGSCADSLQAVIESVMDGPE